jgi:hypothetical protein
MNSFKALSLVATIVLVVGFGTLFWAQSVEVVDGTTGVTEDISSEDEDVVVDELVELEAGEYLVFQTRVVSDAGTDTAANDDIEEYTFHRILLGDSQLEPFATVSHGPEFGGALTSYTLGQNILMHRYQTQAEYDYSSRRPTEGDELDGIMTLQGEVIEVSEEQWGRLQSDNGLFQVDWDSSYDDTNTNMTVTDLSTGEVIAQIDENVFGEGESRWEYIPFLVDDDGDYLYVHESCNCGAQLYGMWEVNLETLEVLAINTIAPADTPVSTSIDPMHRRMLSIESVQVFDLEGPGARLVPPTTIRLVDLDARESKDLIVDNETAWGRAMFDPTGKDRFIVVEYGDESRQYLVDLNADEITDEDFLAEGWILDWVGDWIVLRNFPDTTTTLVNIETSESIEISVENTEYISYLGSIDYK